jgi:glyoxylase-like metal-dependent hydrolase (beta-lactamase superfamily II)
LHVAQQIAVFGRDDDRLFCGDTLWLLPDAPPPAPQILNPPLGDISSGITLRWRNQDVKDGTARNINY